MRERQRVALEERLLRLMHEGHREPAPRRQAHDEQLQTQQLPVNARLDSPKSTLASAPGVCSWPTVTSNAVFASSAFTSATNPRTEDSLTCASCSSTKRWCTRRVVWRCLRGTLSFTSASSQPRITGFH